MPSGQGGFGEQAPYEREADLVRERDTLRAQLDEVVALLRRFAERQREDGSVRVDYIIADTTSARAFLASLDTQGGRSCSKCNKVIPADVLGVETTYGLMCATCMGYPERSRS